MKMFLIMVDRNGVYCAKTFDLDVADGWLPLNLSDADKAENFEPYSFYGVSIDYPNGTFKYPG